MVDYDASRDCDKSCQCDLDYRCLENAKDPEKFKAHLNNVSEPLLRLVDDVSIFDEHVRVSRISPSTCCYSIDSAVSKPAVARMSDVTVVRQYSLNGPDVQLDIMQTVHNSSSLAKLSGYSSIACLAFSLLELAFGSCHVSNLLCNGCCASMCLGSSAGLFGLGCRFSYFWFNRFNVFHQYGITRDMFALYGRGVMQYGYTVRSLQVNSAADFRHQYYQRETLRSNDRDRVAVSVYRSYCQLRGFQYDFWNAFKPRLEYALVAEGEMPQHCLLFNTAMTGRTGTNIVASLRLAQKKNERTFDVNETLRDHVDDQGLQALVNNIHAGRNEMCVSDIAGRVDEPINQTPTSLAPGR